MNRKQLEYFLAVARELNFTKAAEQMYVSQTAITQQIKVLEEQLGVRLFERTKRKVVLTRAGEVFQSEATDIIRRMDMALERVRVVEEGFVGSLEIGFTLGIGSTEVADSIQRFIKEYPNVSLRFFSGSPNMSMKKLREKEVDLVLMPQFDKEYFNDLEYQKIQTRRMIAILPKGHLLSTKSSLSWDDLRNEKLIVASTMQNEVGEQKVLDSMLTGAQKVKQVVFIEDVETIFLMISTGLGITVLPDYMIAPATNAGRMATVPIEDENATLDLVAAWRAEERNPSLELILPFLQIS